MNVEMLIIIVIVAIFLAILFLLYRLFYQKKQFPNDFTTEIEEGGISIETPVIPQSEKEYRGEMDIFIRNKKSSTIKIGDQETRIGRDPLKSTVVIAEPTVSKLHCTVYSKENRLIIRDNGSTNGTFIHNKKLIEHDIQDNDTVSLGKKGIIQLIFRLSTREEPTGD
jgi:hypothetical protein